MRQVLVLLLLALATTSLYAAKLVPCPDSENPVSPRAVMCPHCGCPGDAIAEAVVRAQAVASEPKLGPILNVDTRTGQGHGIGVSVGGVHYLVMDVRLLWQADSLAITPLGTNSPIAYRELELAQDKPLARFRTLSTNVCFLVSTRTGSAQREGLRTVFPGTAHDEYCILRPAEINGANLSAAAGERPPVAIVDAQTNVVGVVFRTRNSGYGYALPPEDAWVRAPPGVLRKQTRLLAEAEDAVSKGRFGKPLVQRLSAEKWFTDYFKEMAARLRQELINIREDGQ